MKIVIYGNGFLGKKLSKALNAPIATGRIKKADDIVYGSKNKPDVIINTIGKTGRPNVDWCEDHKAETYFSNVHVPYLLAEYCQKNNIKLVHVSSGCIYEGDNFGKGWSEEDAPNFLKSFYSWSKAAAERMLSAYDNVLILRIRMPIDDEPSDRELVGKLLKYPKIVNCENSITIISDFVAKTKFLIEKGAIGTWNITNTIPLEHEEILDVYQRISGKKLAKTYISPDELDTPAPRSNCVLSSKKIDEFYGAVETDRLLEDTMIEYVRNEKKS